MTLQLGYLYTFSVCHKSYTSYVEKGDVVLSILQFEHYVSSNPMAKMLLDLPPNVLKYLSVTSFLVELVFGALSLFPIVMPQRTRMVCLVFLTLLQIGFMSNMYLGTFPWICLMLHFACLPSCGWDSLLGSIASDAKHVEHAKDDKDAEIAEDAENAEDAEDAEIAEDEDSKHEHRLPPIKFPSWRSELVALFLVAMALLSNLNTLPKPGTDAFVTSPYRGETLSGTLVDIQEMIGGRQVWNMFPFRSDEIKATGRHIVDGTLSDGSRLDLLTMEAWKEPQSDPIPTEVELEKLYTNFRWRAYWVYIWGVNKKVMIQRAQQFFCHKYNQLGYKLPGKAARIELVKVTIYRLGYATTAFGKLPADYPTKDDPLVESLGQMRCD